MAKYPGNFIINEVGTRKELANIYGVSERTIYRWLNKAAKESGISPKAKVKRPRMSTLEKFTGTRKELAKKYGISERTVYRWLKKAREGGALIPSRKTYSTYPGADIILNIITKTAKTNKDIAQQFGVSERTVNRWINRAKMEKPQYGPDLRKSGLYKKKRVYLGNGKYVYDWVKKDSEDIGEPWEVPDPEDIGEPWEVPDPEDIGEPWEVPDPEDIGEPWEVPPPEPEEGDFFTENFGEDIGPEKTFEEYTQDILDSLIDLELINKESLLFKEVSPELRIIYLMEYISYQREHNPKAFYNVFGDWNMPLEEQIADTIGIVSVNIWGEDLEAWLADKIEIDNT